MDMIREMLSYPFVVRALLGGIMVSLCAALLGVSLVLKRYSMIGDGLSHVSFGALSVAVAVGWSPLKVSIPVVILAAFFLLRITEHGKVKSCLLYTSGHDRKRWEYENDREKGADPDGRQPGI